MPTDRDSSLRPRLHVTDQRISQSGLRSSPSLPASTGMGASRSAHEMLCDHSALPPSSSTPPCKHSMTRHVRPSPDSPGPASGGPSPGRRRPTSADTLRECDDYGFGLLRWPASAHLCTRVVPFLDAGDSGAASATRPRRSSLLKSLSPERREHLNPRRRDCRQHRDPEHPLPHPPGPAARVARPAHHLVRPNEASGTRTDKRIGRERLQLKPALRTSETVWHIVCRWAVT